MRSTCRRSCRFYRRSEARSCSKSEGERIPSGEYSFNYTALTESFQNRDQLRLELCMRQPMV